jgi:hypothetical protein
LALYLLFSLCRANRPRQAAAAAAGAVPPLLALASARGGLRELGPCVAVIAWSPWRPLLTGAHWLIPLAAVQMLCDMADAGPAARTTLAAAGVLAFFVSLLPAASYQQALALTALSNWCASCVCGQTGNIDADGRRGCVCGVGGDRVADEAQEGAAGQAEAVLLQPPSVQAVASAFQARGVRDHTPITVRMKT